MIRAARWQIRQSGWLCLEPRDRPRQGRTGRVLIAGRHTAGCRHFQKPVVCTSRQRVDESAAELEARKSLPSPVDWPKMNEGGCTGPENETRRKGLSAACLLDAFLCLARESALARASLVFRVVFLNMSPRVLLMGLGFVVVHRVLFTRISHTYGLSVGF